MTTAEHGPRTDEVARGERFYQALLDEETRPVPVSLRATSAGHLDPIAIAPSRYFDRDFHQREVEHVWGRVWQMACREEQIPEVGDSLALRDRRLVAHRRPHRARTRSRPSTTRASTAAPSSAPARVTSTLPLPVPRVHLEPRRHPARDPVGVGLPPRRRGDVLPARGPGRDVGRVRLRQRRSAAPPLEDYLEDLPSHFAQWPLEERYLTAHVVRTMPCNWKVALEAFIEAYHTMAVHPQLLTTAADSLTEYDVYGPHVSRMITAVGVSSEHLDRQLDDVEIVRAMLGSKDAEVAVEPGSSARQVLGERVRASLRKRTGRDYSDVTDAELLDGIEYFLFPNFMPWAGFLTSFAYRFRPDGHDPDSCVIDIMVLEPIPDGPTARPPPRPGCSARTRRWADVARARRLRAGVQPGRLDLRAGPAGPARVGAAHDDAGPLPGEPDPALPRDARRLPRARPLMDVRYTARARGAARLRGPGRRPVRPASGRPARRRRASPQARRHHRSRRVARAAHRDIERFPVGIGRRGRDRRGAAGARPGRRPVPRTDARGGAPSSRWAPVRRRARDRGDASRPVGAGRPERARRRHRRRRTPNRRWCSGRTTPSCRSRCRARPRRVDLTRATVAARARRGRRARHDPSRRHRPMDRAGVDGHRGGPRRDDARRHRPDLRVRHGSTSVRSTGRIVPSGAAPAGRCRRPPRRIPGFAAACRVGRRRPRAGRRARRCRLGQGLRLPRCESGARDRHPAPRRHRQHVGVPGARLPAPVPALHRRVRRSRSQPGARARARRRCREVPDGLPRLARGGGVPSAAARVAGGQQPAPSAVVDLRRVLGATARLAPVAPRGPGSSGSRGPSSTAGTTRRRSTTSSSTRSSPGPVHHRGPASATSCRRSSTTPTRT